MTLKMLKFESHGNLAVVQFADADVDTFSYITGATAIEKMYITVGEVNEAGQIDSLIVSNLSPHYVFFMDGDVLVGAKQDRVLATSVLLAPNGAPVIPVSCVERGRWRYTSPHFKASRSAAPASLRANKAKAVDSNLQRRAGFRVDQTRVWSMVTEYQEALGVLSLTSNLSDVYDRAPVEFANYLERFKPDPEANAVAILMGSRLLGLDTFNRRDVFQEYFSGLLQAAVLETVRVPTGTRLSEAEAKYLTLQALNSLETHNPATFPGAGAGQEKRFKSNGQIAFELWFENHLIHRAVFSTHSV